MKKHKLTDEQHEFLLQTIPLGLYSWYNVTRNGEEFVLNKICDNREYSEYERSHLMTLREEYIKFKKKNTTWEKYIN